MVKYLIVIFFVFLLLIVWSAWQTSNLQESSLKYENCIVQQYGEFPVEIYKQTGEFPLCEYDRL